MDENEMLDNELDEDLGVDDTDEELDDGADGDGDEDEYEDEDDDGIDDSGDSDSDADEDDFEYDEEGNIIIPDASENEADGEGDDGEETPSGDADVGADAPDEGTETADRGGTREKELEEELARYKAQSKETLSKLGIEGDDPMEGLIKLAAEAEGVTPEQYKQKLASEVAKQNAANARQAQIEKDDLIALKAVYPELKDTVSIRDIPNFSEFGKFRDMGLNPKQAYSAANPDGIREGVAKSVKAQSLAGTKSHIKSSVPKATRDTSFKLTRSELQMYRDMYPDKSDKEIVALCKQALKS